MNSSNVHLSSAKFDIMKKTSEMRAALVRLPKQYDTSHEAYCIEMKHAKTVPEQVNSIKNTFKCAAGLNEQTLQFLCDLYFVSPLKHPVRNQILKLLITGARLGTGNLDESLVIKCLVIALHQLVDESKTYTESVKWNAAIASITGCFENFDCGLRALEQCLDITFPFACASINKYITELGVLNSPSVRNEYYIYVHNSIRFLLSCVQEFGSTLKSLHVEQLNQLTLNCKEIIMDKEIPMDPRKNAGILMANLAKLLNHFEQFLANAKDTKDPHEIVLAVGIINTCDQDDFQQYSADIRDICGKIEEIANTNATIPNILLCATRALHQISKLSLTFALKSPSTLDDVKLILRKLLIFTVAFMEHHIDSVRHLCRDILRNIVAAARKVQFDFLLQKIYDACNSDRLSLSVKCVVLQQIAAILGTQEIIVNCLRLFSELFDAHLGQDLFVNNLYECLMLAHHKEATFDDWVEIWINYLLNIAALQDQRLPDIETLIVKAVKCEARIVEIIISENDDNSGTHSTDSGSPRGNLSSSAGASAVSTAESKTRNHEHGSLKIPISTKLSVLWAIRKSGIKCENFPQIMQKFSKHLQLCVLSNCDETRIMALRLLVETHKTTEALTLLECKHLITFLEYNANSQNTANHYKSLALLSKALIRCELNLVKLLKGKQPAKLVQNQPLEMKFLQDIMRISIENLFVGANFSRRSLSLQLLEQCLRIGVNCNLKLLQYMPKSTVENLLMILDDSYEMNKELAVGMLKLLQDINDCNLLKSHDINLNLENIQHQLRSLRPKDSVTAAYQLDFYCHKASADIFGIYELPQYEQVLYAAIKWLTIDVKMGLKRAKQSILDAAKFNPLYGLLFAIRRLLRNLDYNSLAMEISWRILIAELICLCKDLTNVVASIVNNSSPEGHIPNDFSDVPNNIIKEETNLEQKTKGNECNGKCNDKGDVVEHEESAWEKERRKSPCKILAIKTNIIDLEMIKTTSQMVLLCAWRTVKEVSLILGEIILYSPIQLNKLTECFLITKEQILEIGEHFKQLLIEIKHRGAFEQVYVGFSKLCCRLWTTECLDLNVLPMLWLKELISFLHKDEEAMFHEKCTYNNNTTRRSAGLPFMVQALITSELKLGTTKSLHYCMSHLFMLCDPNYEKTCIDSRTHALNILRALFRCTDLNEAIGEFVADGVIIAINSYDCDHWSVKNSATLLFSALIIRIFGVQRNRDTDILSIRNKLTGRIFFLRYPKLYDYLLEQLQLAAKMVKQHQRARKLYPLLLLMSRLYPSALEGTESNLKLSSFIPYISQCESCPEMQTRQLAAKAIVALINKDDVPTMILTKCAEIIFMCLKNFNEMLFNKLHGNLIQIFYLIKHYKTVLNAALIGDITATIVSFHECTGLNNFVILKVMLDIFNEILTSLSSFNLAYNVVEQLLHFVNLKMLKNEKLENYWLLYKSYIIYNLHIELISYKDHYMGNDNDNDARNNENEESTCDAGTNIISLDSPLMLELPQQHINTFLSIILLILIREHLLTSYGPLTTISSIEMEDNIDIGQLLEECDIDDVELEFVKALDKDLLKRLATQFKQSMTIYNITKIFIETSLASSSSTTLVNCSDSTTTITTMTTISQNASTTTVTTTNTTTTTTTTNMDHIAITKLRSYAIISILENFDLNLMQLIKDSRTYSDEIKLPIMLCIERAISMQAREYKYAHSCLEYLMTVAEPWQTDCLRLKVACILSLIAMHYPKALEKKRLNFIRPYSYLILTLLMDDVAEVRDFTSKIVLNNLPDDIELGLSQFHYNNVISGDIKIPIRTESIVPTMAQRLFLQYTADMLLQRRMDDNYIINVFKSIVTSLSETQQKMLNGIGCGSGSGSGTGTGINNMSSHNNNKSSSLLGNTNTSMSNSNSINLNSSISATSGNATGAIPKSNTATTFKVYDQHDDDNYSTSSSNSYGFSSSSISSSTTITYSPPSAACDVEIFEKNEQNIYAEPQKTISDAIVVFKTTFKTRFKVLRFIENFMDAFQNQSKHSIHLRTSDDR